MHRNARNFAGHERHGTGTAHGSMPAANARASLMDDVDFVAALDKFDAKPGALTSTRQGSTQASDDLDDVWESRAVFTPTETDLDDEEPDVEYAPPPIVEERHVVRNVAGFFMMMALGGAAAVL